MRIVVNPIYIIFKMPGEVIDQANPPPLPSHLPDRVLELVVKPERQHLDADTIQSLKSFQKAACYIAGCTYSHAF